MTPSARRRSSAASTGLRSLGAPAAGTTTKGLTHATRGTMAANVRTWKCVGVESGTVFPEVELEEGEWVDYDEKVSFTSAE